MLPRKNRLNKNRVEHILKKGVKKSSKSFLYKYLPARDNNHYAVIISKKILPQATERNKLRRQIYEIIGKMQIETRAKFDILVIVKHPAANKDFAGLEKSLSEELNKIHG